MDEVRRRLLLLPALSLIAAVAPATAARRFYPDDPIAKLPPPVDVPAPAVRKLNQLYDFVVDSVAPPARPKGQELSAPAGGVNTLGEVPDSSWYTNRHAVRRMTIAELKQGPARGNQPVPPLRVSGAKTEGVTPGFTIVDAKGRRYVFKSDPLSNPEMASAADVIGSKFFYALGYNAPENYIVTFSRADLRLDERSKITGLNGKTRAMRDDDLERVLQRVPHSKDGRYRMMASFYLPGKLLGPFEYHGTRPDDPNDLVPHENRRDLRGLYVFAAWLNHTDVKAENSMNSLIEEHGVHFIRHYLLDFGAILGSDSDMAKNPRLGHEYMIDAGPGALVKMLSLGLDIPAWQTAHSPDIPAVGHFEAATFQPDKWTSNYPNSAFLNRRYDDTFWAAKQVMAFTDAEIRAIVETGEFTDARATDYITRTLIARRDKIGRVFFAKVLALDGFAVQGGMLTFTDLAEKYNFAPHRSYQVAWSSFDNETGRAASLPGESGVHLPREAETAPLDTYWSAQLSADDPERTVTVYIRKASAGFQVVGIDR